MFDALRFDRKNAEVAQKKQLAHHFLKLAAETEVGSASSELAEIKAVFKYLLSYCLRGIVLKENRNMLYDLLLQAFLTDADIMDELLLLRNIA